MPADSERPDSTIPGPVPAAENPIPDEDDDFVPPPVPASERVPEAEPIIPEVPLTINRRPASGLILSFIAAALVGGLAFAALGDGNVTHDIPALETTGVFYWVAVLVIMALVGTGAQYIEFLAARTAAQIGQPRHVSSVPSAWAIPVTITFGAALLVATYHNGWMLLVGPLITFVAIAGALLSRDLLDDEGDAAHGVAALIHTLDVHFVALITLGTIYLNKFPDWLSATLVGIVTVFLIIETFERADVSAGYRLGYAGLGGLAMWQIALAVNWWPTHGWTGGMVLLVCFYLIAGIVMARAQQGIVRPRDVAWYGGLATIAIVILAITAS